MIGGMVKKLIIVTGDKETVYAELLSSLITLKDDSIENNTVVGIKDGSVEAVVWNENIYNDNKAQLGSNTKLIFIGKNKASKTIIPNIHFDKEMERFGIKIGSVGNKAVVYIEPKILKKDKQLYTEFCKAYLETTKRLDDTVADTNALKEVMVRYSITDRDYYDKLLKEIKKQIDGEEKADITKEDGKAAVIHLRKPVLLRGGLAGRLLSDAYEALADKKDLGRIIPDQMFRYAIQKYYLYSLSEFMEI